MEPKHNLDQWLDHTLAEYGNAEPRAGLENRIMTNLQLEYQRRQARNWWWAFAAVPTTAVVFLAFFLAYRPATPKSLANQNASHAVTASSGAKGPSTANPQKQLLIPKRAQGRDASGRRTLSRTAEARATSMPKLDQFPSRRPLSEQEKLLVAYVDETPETEVVSPANTAKDLGYLQISTLQLGTLQTPKLDSEPQPPKSNATN